MIDFPVDGLIWLMACLLPFIFVQRWLSRELQLVFLIIARKQTIALGLYSLLLFPGVFLHELSHLLMAKTLFVRTGQISFFPKVMPDGMLRMGYVETEKTDIFRSAFIGAAPIIAGAVSVSYLWSSRMGLHPLFDLLVDGKINKFLSGFSTLTDNTLWWLWVYLALAVSITMLPSRSDRRSWVSFGIVLALLIGLGVFAGIGGWMTTNLAPLLNERLFDLARVLGVSMCLQAVLAIFITILRSLLSRIFGFPGLNF